MLFACRDLENFTLYVEICEDLWSPIPPSTFGAMAGATVIANLSASNITVGKADYRRLLCESQSGRTFTGYVFTAAGEGESTTDLAWDGQALICENGDLVAEAERFAEKEQLIYADIDLDRIVSDRASTSSFVDAVHDHRAALSVMRTIEFDLGLDHRPGDPTAAARSNASPTCPPTRPAARSAARRSTTFRSGASRHGCGPRGSTR